MQWSTKREVTETEVDELTNAATDFIAAAKAACTAIGRVLTLSCRRSDHRTSRSVLGEAIIAAGVGPPD